VRAITAKKYIFTTIFDRNILNALTPLLYSLVFNCIHHTDHGRLLWLNSAQSSDSHVWPVCNQQAAITYENFINWY
jgi:hypothetical protein